MYTKAFPTQTYLCKVHWGAKSSTLSGQEKERMRDYRKKSREKQLNCALLSVYFGRENKIPKKNMKIKNNKIKWKSQD